jgi:hypothetical protein
MSNPFVNATKFGPVVDDLIQAGTNIIGKDVRGLLTSDIFDCTCIESAIYPIMKIGYIEVSDIAQQIHAILVDNFAQVFEAGSSSIIRHVVMNIGGEKFEAKLPQSDRMFSLGTQHKGTLNRRSLERKQNDFEVIMKTNSTLIEDKFIDFHQLIETLSDIQSVGFEFKADKLDGCAQIGIIVSSWINLVGFDTVLVKLFAVAMLGSSEAEIRRIDRYLNLISHSEQEFVRAVCPNRLQGFNLRSLKDKDEELYTYNNRGGNIILRAQGFDKPLSSTPKSGTSNSFIIDLSSSFENSTDTSSSSTSLNSV